MAFEAESPVFAPIECHRLVRDDLPKFQTLVEYAADTLMTLFRTNRAAPAQRAGTLIIAQAANEFSDLLFDLASLRGRSALRSARSLFELQVSFFDVSQSSVLATQYLRHRDVSLERATELTLEKAHLRGKALKAFGHYQRKTRRTHAPVASAAIADYGLSFRRNWTSESLFDRTVRQKLDPDGYAFYRLASSVLHGSAGGALGIHRPDLHGGTYRFGPALALCPTAYLYGMTFFENMMREVKKVQPVVVVTDVIAAVQEMIAFWPEYRDFTVKLDRSWWPESPEPGLVAVYLLGRNGSGAWYAHDVVKERMKKAIAPDTINPRFVDDIRRHSEYLDRIGYWDDPASNLGPTGLISVAVTDVPVEPDPQADWQPAGLYLPGPELRLAEPAAIEATADGYWL